MTYSKLDRENYAKKMQEERNTMYTVGKNQLHLVLNDPHSLIVFLELMAKINYTVSNTLLVMNAMPKATDVKDIETWQKRDVMINKGEKGIRILLPDGTYKRKDGSEATSYKVKSVFDISQTNGEANYPIYDVDLLIRAILSESNIQVIEDDVRQVTFDDCCVIYPRNMDDSELFIQLVKYFSEFELKATYKEANTFIPLCIAYMMCHKFKVTGISESNIAMFSDQYFKKLSEDDGKKELVKIQKIYRKISNRMYSYFKKER